VLHALMSSTNQLSKNNPEHIHTIHHGRPSHPDRMYFVTYRHKMMIEKEVRQEFFAFRNEFKCLELN
jgi:hypothetical protein